MREALFIKKNKERWEKIKHSETTNVDEMSSSFSQAVDDLAYARTFYPRSAITRYLNSIASRYYLDIYKDRTEDVGRIKLFFTQSLPMAVYRRRGFIFFAFVAFTLACVIGFYSAVTDPDFTRSMLGSDYVDMTEANIAAGQPFGVYGEGKEIIMWLGIFANNVGVMFRYIAFGLFFGVFTFYLLISEGVRLGAFEFMFYSHGQGLAAVTTVLIHGVLELSSIIIAGGVGMSLGVSFIFPGVKSRLASLRDAAKDGAKIAVGLVPVLLTAGFFEGFVTRHYAVMNTWTNGIILLATGAYIIFYFGIYPFIVARKLKTQNLVN